MQALRGDTRTNPWYTDSAPIPKSHPVGKYILTNLRVLDPESCRQSSSRKLILQNASAALQNASAAHAILAPTCTGPRARPKGRGSTVPQNAGNVQLFKSLSIGGILSPANPSPQILPISNRSILRIGKNPHLR